MSIEPSPLPADVDPVDAQTEWHTAQFGEPKDPEATVLAARQRGAVQWLEMVAACDAVVVVR
ncbi:MAG: hypothetical protein ACKVOX_05695 [Rhizobacter sp.]